MDTHSGILRILLTSCRSNNHLLINLGHLTFFTMRRKQCLSCLCECETLNNQCTISLWAILALWWHLLLMALFLRVIFEVYSQRKSVCFHLVFIFLLHRHRWQYPVAFATWITVAAKTEKSSECECRLGPQTWPLYPSGGCPHTLSKPSSSEPNNTKKPPSPELFILLSLLMISSSIWLARPVKPRCHVKMCCFSSGLTVFFLRNLEHISY